MFASLEKRLMLRPKNVKEAKGGPTNDMDVLCTFLEFDRMYGP